MIKGDFPNFDMIFLQIDDRLIVRHRQWSVIGLADTLKYFQLYITMIPVVIRNRQAGIYLRH